MLELIHYVNILNRLCSIFSKHAYGKNKCNNCFLNIYLNNKVTVTYTISNVLHL